MPAKCELSVSNISLVGSATPKMSSFSSVVTYKVSTMVCLSFYFVFVVLSLSFLGLGPQLYFCLFNFFQLLFASFLHILLLLSSSSVAFLLKVLQWTSFVATSAVKKPRPLRRNLQERFLFLLNDSI